MPTSTRGASSCSRVEGARRTHDDVVSFLADLPASTVRELEGALTGIAGSRLTGTPITRARRAWRAGRHAAAAAGLVADRILKAVCQRFEVVADLARRRPQALSFARQCGMYH
jgi:chromosomal replication initiation ATPase DnaA